jgi:type IV fimbrial biogenesis protein FimT
MLTKSLGRQLGFSMVEIGVTLAIFAALLASALPSMGDWIRNTKVRNATESIHSGLQRARAEALRRNVNVTFWLVSATDERIMDINCAKSSSSGSWVISLNDPAGKCATTASTTTDPMIIEAHAAGDGGSSVTVAAKSLSADPAQCVRFNGFGQVVPSTVPPDDACRSPNQISTVDVSYPTGGARKLQITVSANGAIRMCVTGVPTSDPRACPV